MNRGKNGKMTMLVALTAVLALVLSGCGGDDNSGVEQDLRDQVAMLEGQVSDAQTAQAAAEAARMTAETAVADAMAAQMAAEAERDAANTAKGAAEQAQATAEAAQAEAETAQMAAETAQMTAEEAQAAAERMQAAAEAERDAAAGSLSAAEMARDAAKDAEAAAKVAQAQAEAAQMNAEADSADAMAAQAAAEAAQATAEAALAAANMAAADAMAAQTAAEAAQAAAEAAQATAEMERDAAKAAEMVATAAQTTAEAERDAANTAKMAAEQAQATAEAATTAARAAQKDAEDKAAMYKTQLEALQGTVDTGEMVDANAAAKALLGVLANNNVEYSLPAGVESGGTIAATDAVSPYNKTGLVGTTFTAVTTADDPDATPPTTAAADERQRVANDVSNLMVEVSSDGMLMAEVEDNAAYSMSEMAPDMIEDWRGVMLTRDQADGTMDTVVVYSNIGDDGMESLLDRYASIRPTTTASRMWTITSLADADTNGIADVPNMRVDDTLIPWSEVERPDSETAFAGTGATAMLTFQGTVHNIPGTFSCTTGGSSTCRDPARFSDGTVNTVVYDGTNNLTGASAASSATDARGSWTFVPDEGVSLYTDDETYLTFGWWLDKNAAGNPSDFMAFSTASGKMGIARDMAGAGGTRGTPVAAGTEGSSIRGSATYEGAAAGKYATASTLSADYEGGHFTADATLMVNFDADMDGDSTTTANNTTGVAVSGMIDNFMTGATARPDWSVKLMVDNDMSRLTPATPVTSLVGATGAEMHTAWSTGGSATGTGNWTAMWYGGVTYDAATGADANVGDDDTAVLGIPTAVIGTFEASIGAAARLQGSFGALEME